MSRIVVGSFSFSRSINVSSNKVSVVAVFVKTNPVLAGRHLDDTGDRPQALV